MSTATVETTLYHVEKAPIRETLEPGTWMYEEARSWEPPRFLRVFKTLTWTQIIEAVNGKETLYRTADSDLRPVPPGEIQGFWLKEPGPYDSDTLHDVRRLDVILVENATDPQDGEIALYTWRSEDERLVELRRLSDDGTSLRANFERRANPGVDSHAIEDVELLGVVVAIYRRSS